MLCKKKNETITQPEISYVVNKFSQLMAKPVEFFALSKDYSLWSSVISSGALYFSLHAYYEANWATNPDDCRSTLGDAIYLGPNLVSLWSCKEQVKFLGL